MKKRKCAGEPHFGMILHRICIFGLHTINRTRPLFKISILIFHSTLLKVQSKSQLSIYQIILCLLCWFVNIVSWLSPIIHVSFAVVVYTIVIYRSFCPIRNSNFYRFDMPQAKVKSHTSRQNTRLKRSYCIY